MQQTNHKQTTKENKTHSRPQTNNKTFMLKSTGDSDKILEEGGISFPSSVISDGLKRSSLLFGNTLKFEYQTSL